MAQRFVYDFLLKSEKEIWDFPITRDLRKSCKLARQKKRIEDEKKDAEEQCSEQNLKRKMKNEEIQQIKKTKLDLEDTITSLKNSLVTEALASEGATGKDHATRAASFAKSLVEKEKTKKELDEIQEKLEKEFAAML